MKALLVYLCFAQMSDVITILKGTVEHNGLERFLYQVPADYFNDYDRLHQLVSEKNYDDVATELSRRYKQTEKNRAIQMATIGHLLGAVASARIKQPVSKDAVDGRTDPKFRTICRPYVDAVVVPDLSIPAAPDLLKVQVNMVLVFQSNTEEADRGKVGTDPELRKEYVRRLCLVWARLVQSCLAYRDTFTEDMMRGKESYPRPDPPEFLIHYANGRTDPKRIQDPVQRKAYEEYLAADKLATDRRSAAQFTSACRTKYLKTIRRSLESMYGEDRTKWDELRQIAGETIKDPQIVELVIKELTRRKEPAVWP